MMPQPPPPPRRGAAAFLDRDGTLIDDVGYLSDPARVALRPSAAGAVRLLNALGVRAVVVTNQSGIARKLLTEADYARVHQHLVDLLARERAYLDAAFHCPHLPELSGPCECRKPGLLLYRRAIDELALDPTRCVFIGDRWRDVVPAAALGGRGILVPSPQTPPDEHALARAAASVAPSLIAAVRVAFTATTSPAAPTGHGPRAAP